ncbi:major facilitator superfamily domain-containing protein [Boletus coccyginus]|nr:major facilitator superfamily domain-containing protein [Boletus coccyginus]
MDEETPLLAVQSQNSQQNNPGTQKTPLPWRQLSILLLLSVSEPITSQVIAPFLPQLIKEIGITDGKDARIGYYVGLMHSLFFLTEACTIFHWSRMSDQIGRRPVILTGIFGLSASMWCFGLSKTFWSLVLSRCLNGALNGNIGVMNSMVVEITDSTNIAQAWSILPSAWFFGTTVGFVFVITAYPSFCAKQTPRPLVGGSLERPAERFPEIFGESGFFNEYPYFLPCSVSATFTGLSWLITFLFMKETMKPCMTMRQYLFGGTTKNDNPTASVQRHRDLRDGPAPEEIDNQLPFRALIIRPVLIASGSSAMFSLIDMAVRTIIPVFYAMPIEMGGLGLDPPAIGIILAILGISSGIIQYLFFAPAYDWLGAKTQFLVSVSLCLPVIALFPAVNAAARVYGLSYFVWFLVGLKMTLFVFVGFAFADTLMYISAASPNKASIGATNGLAHVAISLMRAVGPAVVNSAYSLSVEEHLMGGCFAYWVMVAMVGLTLWVGCLLPKKLWGE